MDMKTVISDLEELAYSENIIVIWSDDLAIETPSVVSTRFRVIVMNSKILEPADEYNDGAMELAHEITHVENGDDETVILPFSVTKDVDIGIEHDANLGAIDKLLPFYLADFTMDDTQINVVDFMKQFCIPLHFEPYIREKMLRSLKKHPQEGEKDPWIN